jgi:steroid 5-alpha reductase family enzyme
MNVWLQLLQIWGGSAVVMTLGWLWQLRKDNAGIVDVLWALGLGCAAVWLAIAGDGSVLFRSLLGMLGGGWGLRLAWHLWRRVSREPEDGRYRYLRAHWHGSQLKFFGFFQLQSFVVVLFAVPFLAVARNPAERISVWAAAGLLIWIISIGGESLADRQLAAFRRQAANRGRTCRSGLWRYSRHPNYFFEWLHWLSYVALSVGSPLALWSLLGPVIMYVLLRWVSGIPFTEAQALRSRGEDYRQYQRETPLLFPWFPKRSSALKWQGNGL